MKFGIVTYGDRYEFSDGAPTAGGVLLLDELAMICMTRWISRAKQVRFRGSRLQTGGSCLVALKLASLVASFGGHRPPNNATNQCFDWKDTRATRLIHQSIILIRKIHEQHDLYIAVFIICVCVIWSRRGCTRRARDGSQNSGPGLIMSHHGMQ